MNVWWQHHTVTLSFSNYLLFFLFSQSLFRSCFHSGSVNIIILFVSPVFHWLLTMLCVCVCDTQTPIHIECSPSPFTLCSFTSFYVSTDWRFAHVLLSLLVFPFTLPLPHVPLILLLITSFRTRTNLHTISFLPVLSIPFDVYSFQMKMWIIYLLHTWKVFLKPNPIACSWAARSSYSAQHGTLHHNMPIHSTGQIIIHMIVCVSVLLRTRIHLMDARGGTHTQERTEM